MREKVCSTRARTLRCCALFFFLALEQGSSGAFAVRDDQSGVDVGAVAEDRHALAVCGQAGVPPGFRVRRVAGHRTGGRHHQTCLGVHDDLHVRREPVVSGGCSDLAVADRDEGAVDNPQPVGGIGAGPGRLECEHRAEPLDHSAHGRGRDTEERGELSHGEVRAVVHRHQQHPLGQRKPPRTTPATSLATTLPDCFQQPTESIDPQPRERLHPHPLGPQHPSHTMEMPSSRPSATPFKGCPVTPDTACQCPVRPAWPGSR
ncbi:hypothetical protein SDIAM103S_04680 [Streptomyces diastaticus subsp. diastaticus]